VAELSSLTNKALERLRGFADGNGLSPEAIQIIESDEKVITVEGLIRLEPQFDVQTRTYPGNVKGKDRLMHPGLAVMQQEVTVQRENFMKSKDWLPAAIKELETAPGHGWGMHEAKITLADKEYVLAATENCPICGGRGNLMCTQCQGRSTIICTYCHGQREESCYNCFGRGEDPVNPQQPCPICRGTRFAPCRYCKATGNLPCPACGGHGSTPCADCKGMGRFTQELAVSSRAKINFQIKSNPNLPSGFLRSLDRLGVANLPKSHADIVLNVPDPNNEKDPPNTLPITATLPYADIKLRLNEKTVQIASFGKRGILSGVPPFLDEALAPALEHLEQAAKGIASLDASLEARALRDALKLQLDGKRQPNDLRRLYPIGLSPNTAQRIMLRMEQALRRTTLHTRTSAAILCFLLSALVFSGVLLTSAHAQLAKVFPISVMLMIDILLPALAAGLSWAAITHSARWVLQRHYPGLPVKMSQKIGKLGHGTLAAILAIYVLLYLIASGKFSF